MGVAPGENRRQFVTVVIIFMFIMAGWFLYSFHQRNKLLLVQHSDLTVSVGDCHKKLEECELNKNNCFSEKEVIQTEVEGTKKQVGDQNGEIQSLKEQIAGKDKEIADKQAALDQAQKESGEAKNGLTETQKKLEESDKKLAELTKELETSKAEAEKLKIETKTVEPVVEKAA